MEITERYEHINLFDGLEDLSIFHISDVHLWYSTAILEKLKTLIAIHRPNLIALTGDYYDLPIGAHNFRKFLIEVSGQYTVVFIKGNHDRLYGRRVSDLLSDIPNCFDIDESMYKFQSKNGFCYNIASWKNRAQLPCNDREKNIILIHNPEKIKTKELSNIQFILAGHLHGGQFIFFKTKNNSNFPTCLLYKHCADRKQIKDTTLVVSKGLGDTFPFRFNCPKEIVKIMIS